MTILLVLFFPVGGALGYRQTFASRRGMTTVDKRSSKRVNCAGSAFHHQ